MSKQVKHRRGTTAQINAAVGAQGELLVDTSKNTVVVMDGSTSGGHPLVKASRQLLGSDFVKINGDVSANLSTDITIALAQLPARTVLGNSGLSTGDVEVISFDDLGGSVPDLAANTLFGNNTGSTAAGTALTTSQVRTLLGYALTTDLSAYVTSSALSTTLGSYVTSASLSTTLSSYATLAYLATTLTDYIVVGDLWTDAATLIPEASTGSAGLAPALPMAPGETLKFLRGDGTYAEIPAATTLASGLAPALPATDATLKFLRGDGSYEVPPGGSGVAEADLPDNIAVSFDGRSHLEIAPGYGDLASVAASEKFALHVSGHELRLVASGAPTQKTYAYALDPLRHKTHLWYSGATTAVVVMGGISANVAGTIFNLWPSSASEFANLPVTYLAMRNRTSAGANSYAGWWGTTYAACVANTARTKGGFIFRARISPAFATAHTTSRMFFGLYPNDPRAANIDYGATAHHVGFCLDPGDTNLCFSIRGSAARQKVTLGANFPGNLVDSTSNNNTYILSIYNPRQFPDLFFVTAECEETGNTFSQVITASGLDKPDADKGLYKILYCNNSTVAVEPGFRFISSQLITGV